MTEFDPTVLTIIIGKSGEIETISAPAMVPLFEFSAAIEVSFGFSTEAAHPIEVVAEHINGMAVLEDTAVETVTADLLATLDFTNRVISIDNNDLVVLRTNDERYVMLGEIMKFPDATVRFTYWRPGAGVVPEPATLLLLSVGLLAVIGIMRRNKKNNLSTGGKCMKYVKTLLLAVIVVSLLIGSTSAATLKVIKIGTGKGIVEGGRIFCGSSCEETYKQKTVVHLKAIPDDHCQFIGWMVDGTPTQGVITIDQEDILMTAKFESNSKPSVPNRSSFMIDENLYAPFN